MRRPAARLVAGGDGVQAAGGYSGSVRGRLGSVGASESAGAALLGVLVDGERVALLRLVDSAAPQ